MFRLRAFAAFATALCLCAVAPEPAAATTVTPVILDLQSSGRGVVANLSVNNTGATPLPIEIVVTPLQPNGTGLEPSKDDPGDLLVVPPSALIPPGQTQTFRIQWVGDPDLVRSRHFYVGVNQLPVKLPGGTSAVQIVYNFQVLVSVSGAGKKAELTVKSAAPTMVDGKAVAAVTVENGGQAHGYISQHRLKLTQVSATGAELSSRTIGSAEFQQLVGYGLVASGQTRTVMVPLDKPVEPGSRLSAELMDERAQ